MALVLLQILLRLITISVIAKGEFPWSQKNCGEGTRLYEFSNYMQETIDGVEESPFMLACQEPPGLLNGRPITSVFKRDVPPRDQKGRTSRQFLHRVLQKAQQRVQESFNQVSQIRTCLQQADKPGCAELRNWAFKSLPEAVADARYHLSLSQSSHQLKTWLGIMETGVNSKLKPLGGFKLVAWQPLQPDEKSAATGVLDEYMAELIAKAKPIEATDGKDSAEKFMRDGLTAVRYQHFQAYQSLMAEFPVLQYIDKPDVSPEELESVFTRMIGDLNTERLQLEEWSQMLDRDPISPEVLPLLTYSSMVEETLLEDNQDCAIAVSLLNTLTNRQMGTALGIGVPIMAASALAPPLVALGLGFATGAGFTYHSYRQLQDVQRRALGHVYGDGELGSDMRDLGAAKRQLTYDLVTMPIGFGVANYLLSSIRVGARAYATGIKMFKISKSK